jgi:hypothetical protein
MIRPNLAQLVTSLKTSKKLKKLGVNQISFFYHVHEKIDDEWQIIGHPFKVAIFDCCHSQAEFGYGDEIIAAFTATEISAMSSWETSFSNPQVAGEYLISEIAGGVFTVSQINANLRRFWEQKEG